MVTTDNEHVVLFKAIKITNFPFPSNNILISLPVQIGDFMRFLNEKNPVLTQHRVQDIQNEESEYLPLFPKCIYSQRKEGKQEYKTSGLRKLTYRR